MGARSRLASTLGWGSNLDKMWVEGTNRFNLERPPNHWLQSVYDYDSQLVIVASQVHAQYLLCRRRFYTKGMTALSAAMENPHPDTVLIEQHGLLPITSFKHDGIGWDPIHMVKWLAEHDVKAAGAEKAADHLDEQDRLKIEQQKETVREDMDYRSRDAWRSYNARAGSRNKSARDGNRFAYGRKMLKLFSRPFGRTNARADEGPLNEPTWRG